MYESARETWDGWSRSLMASRRQLAAPASAEDLAVLWLTMALPLPRLLARRATKLDLVLLAVRLRAARGARRGPTARAGSRSGSPRSPTPRSCSGSRGRRFARHAAWRGRTYPRARTAAPMRHMSPPVAATCSIGDGRRAAISGNANTPTRAPNAKPPRVNDSPASSAERDRARERVEHDPAADERHDGLAAAKAGEQPGTRGRSSPRRPPRTRPTRRRARTRPPRPASPSARRRRTPATRAPSRAAPTRSTRRGCRRRCA